MEKGLSTIKENTSKSVVAAAVKEALAVVAAAAREATQLVASDVRDAAKLLASNAADAAKIANAKGADDHDLLTKVDTKLEILRSDLKEYKNEKADKHDVEELKTKFHDKNEKQDEKIDALEKKTANYTITMVLYSIAVAFMISLTLYHIISKS